MTIARRRIYIAGPMSGHLEFNYPSFEQAEVRLRAAGHEVVSPADRAQLNPADPDSLAPGVTYEQCLAEAIAKLLTCEAVALLPGWEDSHGARLEVELSHLRGLDVAPLERWLNAGALPGDAFGLPPVTALNPKGPAAGCCTAPRAHRVEDLEPDAPTVMVSALGTPAQLREGHMRLGRKIGTRDGEYDQR